MKKFLARIAAALISTVVSLAIAEVAVRTFNIGPEIAAVHAYNYRLSENPVLGYELLPGSVDGETVINDHGMRDRDCSIRKPADTLRIAFIGDSVCYGYRVYQQEALSEQLEQLLAKVRSPEHPQFEVLNFGVTGYNFKQIMENFEKRVLTFDPDLVVYVYCLNDPQEYSLEMENLLAKLTEAEKNHLASRKEPARSWLHRSRLFLLARLLVQSRSAEAQSAPAGKIDTEEDPQFAALGNNTYAEYYTDLHMAGDTWDGVVAGLQQLASWSRKEQVPVHMVLYPVLEDLGEYPLTGLHADLQDRFRSHGFETFDVTRYFSAYEAAGKGRLGRRSSLHPIAEGHELAAVGLLYDLVDEGLVGGLAASRVRAVLDEEADYSDAISIIRAVDARSN